MTMVNSGLKGLMGEYANLMNLLRVTATYIGLTDTENGYQQGQNIGLKNARKVTVMGLKQWRYYNDHIEPS